MKFDENHHIVEETRIEHAERHIFELEHLMRRALWRHDWDDYLYEGIHEDSTYCVYGSSTIYLDKIRIKLPKKNRQRRMKNFRILYLSWLEMFIKEYVHFNWQQRIKKPVWKPYRKHFFSIPI